MTRTVNKVTAYRANGLGRIATLLGDYAQAEQLVNEALAVRRRISATALASPRR